MEYICDSLEKTKEAVKEFLKTLVPHPNHATIIELVGDLGAGKTTFTKILGEELRIQETIISPTFVIQKRYPIPNHPHFKTLVHVDAYRFENPDEAKILGIEEDIQNKENLIIIEWPSKIQDHIKNSIQIYFEHIDETTRKISW